MRVLVVVASLGAFTVSAAPSLASPSLKGGVSANAGLRVAKHAVFGSTDVYTPPRNEKFEGSPAYEGPSYWRFGNPYRQGYR
jgi:hypothetical protein